MKSKSLLSLEDLTEADLDRLTDRSMMLARDFKVAAVERSLIGKRIALIADDGGWRNTTALDLGAQMLGAECIQVPVALSGREVVADLAQYLSNWFDLIAIRSPSLEQMTDLARRATIPVLNLRTRQNHPCEILGDLSFIKETGRSLRGLSVVAVCAAGNRPFLGGSRLGLSADIDADRPKRLLDR